jgi:hypothetical protein
MNFSRRTNHTQLSELREIKHTGGNTARVWEQLMSKKDASFAVSKILDTRGQQEKQSQQYLSWIKK